MTDVDAEGRALFQRWGEACGLTLSVDRLGNMLFRREGRDPTRAPVAIGSHLDTQPTGGKFDGVLGVLAGLEVMRALHEAGAETEAPLLLINWTNEEGARFSPPMMGSGAAMGIFTEAEILAKRDAAGAVFGEELKRIGWQGSADPAALQNVGAYLELHIEQGKLLEDEGYDVGIVTKALGQSWFEVVVEGEESHGGSAMAGRRDAMMAAAPLIAAVEEIALATVSPTGEPGRGTVGVVEVYPSSRNIAPSRVFFSVDMRHGDPDCLTRMGEALTARAAEISAARKVTATVGLFWHSPLTPFDPALVQRARDPPRRAGHRGATSRPASATTPSTWPEGAHGDGLHPLPRRHQPQRSREHHPRMGDRRPAGAGRCGAGDRGAGAPVNRSKPMRIAIGGFLHESHSFAPLPTG